MTTRGLNGHRIGFDIGGTFTDIVVVHADGRVEMRKVFSDLRTLVAEVRAIIAAAQSTTGNLNVGEIAHATTIASNTMLEGTYATTGLITTAGFRDEVELRRLARPPVYDFGWERLVPIVSRRRRVEVVERINADGTVLRSLDPNSVEVAARTLSAQRAESIAICLLNAHVNGVHEDELARALISAVPGVFVSTSHEVLAKSGEYERASTTCVNAALKPVVNRYLDRIEQGLDGYANGMKIMQSNGGLMTVDEARRFPVRMVESGPAAGVLCAAALSAALGLGRAVAFDMGGTTVKACLIDGERPAEKYEYEVGGTANTVSRYDRGAGFALGVPSFDIVEAGAGGGSIAWADNGVLRVGPRSAGAVPGPACYNRGGAAPTVTDADVALGYINPTAIADDTLTIHPDLARQALARLGTELGMDADAAAYGVHQIVSAAMMRTIRAVTTERGHDPRDYAMIAFGGCGPAHAGALADALQMKTIIIPPLPGVYSALGLLVSDVRYDAIRAIGKGLHAAEPDDILDMYNDLTDEIRAAALKQNLDVDELNVERYADLRYLGQATELVIRVSHGEEGRLTREALASLFHEEHARMFGYSRPTEPLQLSAIRVRAYVPTGIDLPAVAARILADDRPWTPGQRMARFGDLGRLPVQVVPRRALREEAIEGPAIIEEPDTTVVVPPGWTARLNSLACIVMTRRRYLSDENVCVASTDSR